MQIYLLEIEDYLFLLDHWQIEDYFLLLDRWQTVNFLVFFFFLSLDHWQIKAGFSEPLANC